MLALIAENAMGQDRPVRVLAGQDGAPQESEPDNSRFDIQAEDIGGNDGHVDRAGGAVFQAKTRPVSHRILPAIG